MKIIPVKVPHKNASVPCYVDDWDYEILKSRKWSLNISKNKEYIRTAFTNKELFPHKRQIYVNLHRIILWCPKGFVVDHKDGNNFNNQQNNLRIATLSQNAQNSKMRKGNSSGLKGVSWSNNHKKWIAQIGKNNKNIYLGMFDTPEEAHEVYKKAALELHKDFARYE